MYQHMIHYLETKNVRTRQLITEFSATSPLQRMKLQEFRFTSIRKRLRKAILVRLESHQAEFGKRAALLDSLSPLSVLSRGYAIVSKADKRRKRYCNNRCGAGENIREGAGTVKRGATRL